MKILISVFLVSFVAAMPSTHSNSEEHHERDVEGLFAFACIGENWNDETVFETNLLRINNCNKCFEEIEDPMSEDGIESGKTCLSTYLPLINTACSEEIASVVPQDEQSAAPLLDCMGKTMSAMVAERCIEMTTGNNVQEELVEGILCSMETVSNVTDLLKFMVAQEVSEGGLTEDEAEEYLGELEGKEEMMEEMLPQAFCNLAAGGDDQKDSNCKECEINSEDVEGFLNCKSEYYMPKFQECDSSLAELTVAESDSEEMVKAWHQADTCLKKVFYRNVVDKCSIDVYSVTPQVLVEVTKCASLQLMSMASKNMRPEIMELIQQHAVSGHH